MRRKQIILTLKNLLAENEDNLLIDEAIAIRTAIKIIKKQKEAEKEFWKGLFLAVLLGTIYFVFKFLLYEVNL